MDILALRLLFVAGLVVLGGLALVAGLALSTMSERWSQRSRRAAVSRIDTRILSRVSASSLRGSPSRVDTCKP